ncbi:MAG: MFS transporter [Chloroflexota bacterium]
MAYVPPKNGFRTFLIVLVTQSVSVLGSALTFFVTNVWVAQVLYGRPEQKAQLAMAVSVLGLAFALPTILLAPLAGAFADRHDRKRIMFAMDIGSGLLSVVLAVLFLTNSLDFPTLVALMVLFAAFGQFHNAAFDASQAMLVPEHLLARANGMMQTLFGLTNVIAPTVAASIMLLPGVLQRAGSAGIIARAIAGLSSGAPVAIILDAISFFIAAAVLPFLHIPSPQRHDLTTEGGPKKSIWADVREGAVYIWRRRPLLWLLATFTVINFCSGPVQVFLTLMLKFNLAADWARRGLTFEAAMAVFSTVISVGGIAGGLLISTWGGLKNKRVYGVLVPQVLSGLAQIAFGLSPLFMVSAALLSVIIGLVPVMNAHSQTIWQTQVPRELQGRVFAVRRVIAQCSWPLSTAVAGWAGARYNPGGVLAVLGVITAAWSLSQLFNRTLLRVEDKAWLDGMAAQAQAQESAVAQ